VIVAGVMSGTSADGINVAVVRVSSAETSRKKTISYPRFELLGHAEYPYPSQVRRAILASMNSDHASVGEVPTSVAPSDGLGTAGGTGKPAVPAVVKTKVSEAATSDGFLTRFNAITRGVIDAKDFTFFASLIACAVFANAILLDLKKAD